jgi:phosphoenolpyruvate carboxykinase (GTP)
VLKWVIERIEGRSEAVDTVIGRVPTADQLDLSGLDTPVDDVNAALAVDADEWRAELPLIDEWFAKIGDALPTTMLDELDALKGRLRRP